MFSANATVPPKVFSRMNRGDIPSLVRFVMIFQYWGKKDRGIRMRITLWMRLLEFSQVIAVNNIVCGNLEEQTVQDRRTYRAQASCELATSILLEHKGIYGSVALLNLCAPGRTTGVGSMKISILDEGSKGIPSVSCSA